MDARGLLQSGIGRYLREVLSYLLSDARFTEVRLLGEPAALREFTAAARGGGKATIISYPYGFYSPRAQLAWLRVRHEALDGADVVFFPHYDAPYVGVSTRSVVTVHDLIHFKFPAFFPWWRRAVASAFLKRTVARANRIAVHSQHARDDLEARLGSTSVKTRVVPLGVSEFFRSSEMLDGENIIGAVRDPFLLCVGNRKPHKNLMAAVEVLARARRDVADLELVIVGTRYPEWASVAQRARELEVESAIVELTDVSDAQLRTLYRRCRALLFLSRYEGFGLPILEAMACGAPVIASNRSSIPEVVGKAGILVDPDDHASAAAAVVRLFADPHIAAQLAEKGRLRAKEFSWLETGRRTADLLFEAATSPADS